MNQKIFENIALEMESVLEKEAQRLQNLISGDRKEDRLTKFMYSYYPTKIESVSEATNVAKILVKGYKKIAKESNDFNTNMMAFASLYNFLKMEDIIDKINKSIILDISEILADKGEIEYFFELVEALNDPTEKAFLQLQHKRTEMEIAYVYLAVIYLQTILDYRTNQKEKNYEDLAYCFSKLDGKLRWTILYGYRDIDFLSFDIFKSKSLKHYSICLPYVHVRELSDLEGEYEARSNKNIAWSDFISNTSYNKNTLCCHQAIVETGKLYDEMGIIISKMGNYVDTLENQNVELRKLQEERHSVIRDFSHTYENMQAIGLKEIANILLENTDEQVKQCGRVILAEYGIKDSLKAEVSLLRLNFEDKQADIAELINKGVHKSEKDNCINIEGIFEDALKICMLRVIYSGNPRGEDRVAKDIYKRIKNKVGSMKEFVGKFENDIIVKGTSVREFLNKYGIAIDFDSDEEWNSLFFVKNRHAEVLIRSIFGEQITNFFKYADLNDKIKFNLKVNDGKFGIAQSNSVSEILETESGVGISSKGQILQKMNGYKSYFVKPVINMSENNIFKVVFVIDKKLFNVSEEENV